MKNLYIGYENDKTICFIVAKDSSEAYKKIRNNLPNIEDHEAITLAHVASTDKESDEKIGNYKPNFLII